MVTHGWTNQRMAKFRDTTPARCSGVAEAAAAAGEEQLQRNQRSLRTTAAEPYSTHGRRPRSPQPPPPPSPPPPPPSPSAQVPQTLDGRQSPTDRHRTSACLRQQSFSHTAHRRHRLTYKATFWECIKVQVYVPDNTAKVERTTARSLLDYTRGNRCGKSRTADLLRYVSCRVTVCRGANITLPSAEP
ncbi:Uncharacterized protein FWK35_00012825 [Aphis craccivora]|uniref:Uncharacterized protein n=1 Tax=Aphis craccivora TaxID=307492 RepID=A0A6G0ZQP8_APHCR|nr:Uncharacterized protein FWK35_00012825 [Aphis craccivora]